LVLSSIAAPFFCEDIATPCAKRTPARGASLYRAARWRTITELQPALIFGAAQNETAWGHSHAPAGRGRYPVCAAGRGTPERSKSLRAFHRLDRVRAGARCRASGG